MIEEIFGRSADAAVVVRSTQHDHFRFLDAGLQFSKPRKIVGDIRIIKCERLFREVEHIHRATSSSKSIGNIFDHRARDRFAVQAADYGHDVERCFRHEPKLAMPEKIAQKNERLESPWSRRFAMQLSN